MSDRISTARARRRYLASSDLESRTVAPCELMTSSLIGRSKALLHLAHQVRFAASNRLPVLILGETGTGKNLLARTIHSAQRSSSSPFVRYAPSFGSQDHVISELFGHSRGAYTGAIEERRGMIEEANRGTLFLDEVVELPTAIQILLLDTLQTKEFRRLGSNRTLHSDFRYMAATNVSLLNLKQRVRADFLFRTSHFTIHVPSLRERREDIPHLARAFLDQYSRATKCNVYSISRSALSLLQSHAWPGNVRELQASVEYATAHAHFLAERVVRPEHFQFGETPAQLSCSFRGRVQRFEESLIVEALERTGGNQQQAASLLNIDRSLLRRIQSRISMR